MKTTPQRPRQLIMISVLTMVLGGVDIVLSISGLAQWLSGNFSGGSMSAYGNSELLKLNQRMISELAEAITPWQIIIIPILIVVLLTSVLLIAGGFQTFKVRPIGRKIVMALFWVLVPLDIVRSILNTIIGHKTSDIMVAHVARVASIGHQPGQIDVGTWISGISQVGMYAGLAFGVLWSVAKITFYVLGLKYLRRPDIAHLFETKERIPPPLPPANKRWD
jgi:hypothetical protein